MTIQMKAFSCIFRWLCGILQAEIWGYFQFNLGNLGSLTRVNLAYMYFTTIN